MERHRFDALTCYVNREGKVDSIYERDDPVAEDGFFGVAALKLRDEITREANQEIDLAKEQRQKAVDAAQQQYDTINARIMSEMSQSLEDVRARSDPFSAVSRSLEPNDDLAASEETEELGSLETPSLIPATDTENEITSTTPKSQGEAEETTPAPGSQAEQAAAAPSSPGKRYWVTSSTLTRRTCPSPRCGSVGWFGEGQSVKVFEERNGWARVTKYYFTNCLNGFSEYVDSGDARCIPANGITNGKFAEWVYMRHLFAERPARPTEPTFDMEELVKGSDNLGLHKDVFVAAARELINSGTCKGQDFIKVGGWIRSLQRGEPFYFTYCGGSTIANRLYLDASTGQILK
ncbi:MAG: SH3 domain-containing protein [Boseongicola sp.]|nr:SH3 domain-containing protein [Boseongicola sp.]